MRVSGLFIYPQKSGRGIALSTSQVGATGLEGDRRAMITDPSGRFITQRDLPSLARIIATPIPGGLRLGCDGHDGIDATVTDTSPRMTATVWDDAVDVAVAAKSVNAWLSDILQRDVRLVFFDAGAKRFADGWAGADAPVTFSDGYQILVTTTGSLAAINADLAAHGEGPVGMDRFRPNIVIDCDEPWAEDRWAALEIGGLRLDLVKPCARCIMTTQDQLTGSRAVANPMPSLSRLHMSDDRRVPGPLFGWNAVPRSEGRVSVGDVVEIAGHRAEGWPIKAPRTTVA